MKSFEDLKFESFNNGYNSGVRARLMFDNGYGVSVIQSSFSYGHIEGLYELAVLDSQGDLHYDNEVANGDVRGWLSPEEVTECMHLVQKFENSPKPVEQ